MKTFWLKPGRLAFMWIVVALMVQGCPKDDPDNEYQEINDWILANMEANYFWNTQIPSNSDKSLYPEDYFESLKYSGDRFSVIYDNFTELINSLSGVNTEAGYDYYLMKMSSNKSDINVRGYITYIKPGTPAEAAGLKRGDHFLEINNTQMTTENLRSLIPAMAKPHTFGKAILSGNTITGISNISLSVIEYKENPIFLDTIYHIQNKKIGYLVYNFFARDSETAGITYEKELNDLFGKFNTEVIDELIVDLRYNSGGTVITAMALASMISNRSANDVFGYEEYNSILDAFYAERYGVDYNISYFLDDIEKYDNNNRVVERIPIKKLSGLNRVYLIVSDLTASASELIINGLRPYMGDDNVVLIGYTTTGKNVGSFTIYETDPVKQKTNNWGMQPIIFRLSNSKKFSDYANGFTPDVKIHEAQELDMKPLGDTDELLLSTTLNKIFGISTPKRTNLREKPEAVGSSIDRTPARKNMYIDPHTFHRNKLN